MVVTEQDVIDVVVNNNVNKTSGPDMFSPRMLKEAGASRGKSLCKLFNLSLSSGTFPAT